MKLLGYIIDRQTIGKDIFGWKTEDLNNNEPFKVSSIVDSGYDEISSIETWSLFYNNLVDYKYARNEILTLVWTKMLGDPSNWDNLTTTEKQIASSWFVVPKELRDTIHTINEQINYAEIFDSKSILTREIRFNKAKYEIYNRLTITESNIILNEIEKSISTETPNLGTVEGDPEGLFDYILSRTGTSFDGNGLTTHTYTPTGYSNMTDFVNDKLIKILKDGIY
jgi:hypothetical protein